MLSCWRWRRRWAGQGRAGGGGKEGRRAKGSPQSSTRREFAKFQILCRIVRQCSHTRTVSPSLRATGGDYETARPRGTGGARSWSEGRQPRPRVRITTDGIPGLRVCGSLTGSVEVAGPGLGIRGRIWGRALGRRRGCGVGFIGEGPYREREPRVPAARAPPSSVRIGSSAAHRPSARTSI
jgi:hypothetical protein